MLLARVDLRNIVGAVGADNRAQREFRAVL